MEQIVRNWTLRDAADIAAALNNKHVQDNLRDGIPYPYTAADAEEFIALTLQAERDSMYIFAIVDEDKAIGSISVTRQGNIHHRTGELGYYVAEPYWGRGIATKAVGAVCRHLFANTDLLRIYAEPFAHNAASCRVLEKAGFVCEGVLRKNAVKNGRVLDMKMYALVRE